MSNYLNNDQEVIEEGRKQPLEDVVVPLRDQIITKLVTKLEDKNAGLNAVEIWEAANADRQDWLTRRHDLLSEYDEFINPIRDSSQEWASNIHLPVALTICKTYHARMFAALIGIDPPFTVKARQAANQDRSMLIQELMRYTISSWINHNQGIEEVVDNWLWQWVTQGVGILKLRWAREYSRYIDVVTIQEPGPAQFVIDPNTGQEVVVRPPVDKEIEKEVTKTCFDGPVMEFVPAEDLVIVGGSGDPQNADHVFHSSYMTASELWSLADQKVFRKDIVEDVIESGEDYIGGQANSDIKMKQAAQAGVSGPDKEFDLKRYHILECHMKIDVDGSGINSDIIMWVHKDSRKILRATYLYRVQQQGLRPFFKIDFHKRQGQTYGVGLIELLYSLTTELDAMTNMKIDFGLLSSMPFGYYRASASMEAEKIPIEPGSMIPLDNPQTDVYFPQLGNRSVFTAQEEAQLYQQIERFTSISDMSLGIIGAQGATRTATGARALLGESNANLDIFLRRMNRGWKRALIYLFQMLQQKIQPGFQFRILGDDGNMYWEQIKDPKELQGMYDFELEPNSANSNKTIQIEQANAILQTIANPLFMQMGIVSQENIYQSLKYKFQVEGVRDFSRFLTKPNGITRIFTPEEFCNRILSGQDVPLDPTQDFNGILAYMQYIFENDELLGQFNEAQAIKLAKKQQEVQQYMQAMEAQAAQQANANQMSLNAGMAQAPTPMPMGSTPQQTGS